MARTQGDLHPLHACAAPLLRPSSADGDADTVFAQL